ncbi:hypothetical protein QBC32DRAFT_381701 [Pseudoneurospora amorphoporcata]|uniref:Uncharacterized protein n=1 Tax=Pseudoneurospora amorphoporcata TaxID=241081 RepID=A0AAN6NNU9_9PEZI|nr:hypothetical protein QBC32DRAFT_381701 [Pseudoneurospora amorphoporcata]
MPLKRKPSSARKTKIKATITPSIPRTPRITAKTTNKTTASPSTNTVTMKKTPPSKRKAIRHHACRLKPPCKQGHGGPAETIGPIGKFFYSEEALIHDLGALKRGAVCKDEMDFYKRVKSWYKAEVDRCMHKKWVESEVKKEREKKEFDKIMIRPTAITKSVTTKGKLAAGSDANNIDLSDDSSISAGVADNPSDSEYSDFDDTHLRKAMALATTTPIRKNPQALQTPSPTPDKPTPTRVQPSRAVKRKAEALLLPPTPPQTPSSKRQKVTLIIKRPNAKPEKAQSEKTPVGETQGDYSLSKLDFQESQPSYADRGDLADGMDVAYFMISVEKAIEAAINELVASRLGNRVRSLSSPRENNQGIRARWRRYGSISHAEGQGRIVQEESKDEEEVFEPAGDAVPGEDWRPLAPSCSAPETKKGVLKKGLKKGLELRLASREGTPAPEAPMELSPTLGRWQVAGRRASGSSAMRLRLDVESGAITMDKESGAGSEGGGAVVVSPVEESSRRSVQVSGLKFDVELRARGTRW